MGNASSIDKTKPLEEFQRLYSYYQEKQLPLTLSKFNSFFQKFCDNIQNSDCSPFQSQILYHVLETVVGVSDTNDFAFDQMNKQGSLFKARTVNRKTNSNYIIPLILENGIKTKHFLRFKEVIFNVCPSMEEGTPITYFITILDIVDKIDEDYIVIFNATMLKDDKVHLRHANDIVNWGVQNKDDMNDLSIGTNSFSLFGRKAISNIQQFQDLLITLGYKNVIRIFSEIIEPPLQNLGEIIIFIAPIQLQASQGGWGMDIIITFETNFPAEHHKFDCQKLHLSSLSFSKSMHRVTEIYSLPSYPNCQLKVTGDINTGKSFCYELQIDCMDCKTLPKILAPLFQVFPHSIRPFLLIPLSFPLGPDHSHQDDIIKNISSPSLSSIVQSHHYAQLSHPFLQMVRLNVKDGAFFMNNYVTSNATLLINHVKFPISLKSDMTIHQEKQNVTIHLGDLLGQHQQAHWFHRNYEQQLPLLHHPQHPYKQKINNHLHPTSTSHESWKLLNPTFLDSCSFLLLPSAKHHDTNYPVLCNNYDLTIVGNLWNGIIHVKMESTNEINNQNQENEIPLSEQYEEHIIEIFLHMGVFDVQVKVHTKGPRTLKTRFIIPTFTSPTWFETDTFTSPSMYGNTDLNILQSS